MRDQNLVLSENLNPLTSPQKPNKRLSAHVGILPRLPDSFHHESDQGCFDQLDTPVGRHNRPDVLQVTRRGHNHRVVEDAVVKSDLARQAANRIPLALDLEPPQRAVYHGNISPPRPAERQFLK